MIQASSHQFQHSRTGVHTRDPCIGIELQQLHQKPTPAFTQQEDISRISDLAEELRAATLQERASGDAFKPAIVRRNGVEAHAGKG